MSFSRVLALLTDDRSDVETVTRAIETIRDGRGSLILTYVIRVQRSLPLDAEIEDQIKRGEQTLQRAELLAETHRGNVETQLLQAREIGPAVVHEAVVREVDAIVIGTSNTKEYGSFSLGTYISYILEHAPCDVILWCGHKNEAETKIPNNGRIDHAS